MITGIVLGSLALLCALALSQRVWIKVVWASAGRSIEVRYVLLHFHVPGKRRKVKEGKRAREKARKRGRRGVLGRRDVLGWIKLALELLQASEKGLKYLLQHSELRHLQVKGIVGTEDVATTGILWGTIQAVYWTTSQWVSKLELTVAPDFAEGKTSLTLDAEGAVRLGVLLATPAIIVWSLPKRKLWQLLWKQRRMRKASRKARFKLKKKRQV